MTKIGPIQIETGYGLIFLAGLAIWIGVPVLNTTFGTGIMTGYVSLPIIGGSPLYAAIGGGLAGTGFIIYIGHLLNWWQ